MRDDKEGQPVRGGGENPRSPDDEPEMTAEENRAWGERALGAMVDNLNQHVGEHEVGGSSGSIPAGSRSLLRGASRQEVPQMPVDGVRFVPPEPPNQAVDAGEMGREMDDAVGVQEGEEDERERQ